MKITCSLSHPSKTRERSTEQGKGSMKTIAFLAIFMILRIQSFNKYLFGAYLPVGTKRYTLMKKPWSLLLLAQHQKEDIQLKKQLPSRMISSDEGVDGALAARKKRHQMNVKKVWSAHRMDNGSEREKEKKRAKR